MGGFLGARLSEIVRSTHIGDVCAHLCQLGHLGTKLGLGLHLHLCYLRAIHLSIQSTHWAESLLPCGIHYGRILLNPFLQNFLKAKFLLLQLKENLLNLFDCFLQDMLFLSFTQSYKFHLSLDLTAEVGFVQVYAQLLVGLYQGDACNCWLKVARLGLDRIVSLLNCFQMLVDRSIRTDSILVHCGD